MKDLVYPVYEFRPEKIDRHAVNLMRYNNGDWIDDDGEYDIAFISKTQPFAFYVYLPYYDNLLWSWCKNGNLGADVHEHPNSNAWHYMTKDGTTYWGKSWDRNKHPNIIAGNKAMGKVCENRGCANGRRVEFDVNDETVNAGLLRIRETKEIVTPPQIFKCIYCGEHDWKQEQLKSKQ